MERLTKMHYKSSDGHYMACSELLECEGKCADCPYLDNMVERLAAYEDTHMMPSDVTSMRMDMAILTALFNGIDVDRMREIVAAEKDGRVVVLPCKVGDKLYRVFAGGIFEHRVGSMKYFAIQGQVDIETYPFCPYVESSIGKTIFLTREEAEKALEAMENG